MTSITVTGQHPPFATASMSESRLLTRHFTLCDPYGLHARPATLFVRMTRDYDADIMVENQTGRCASGKCIIELLTLGVLYGDPITVTTSGPDAAEAMTAIEGFFGDIAQMEPAPRTVPPLRSALSHAAASHSTASLGA